MTNHQGVVETARLVRDKKATASQTLDDCIERIRSGDSKTRAFMRIDEDSARLQAKTVDDAIAATLILKKRTRNKNRRDRGLVALAALDAHGDFFRAGPVLEEVDDAHVAYVDRVW